MSSATLPLCFVLMPFGVKKDPATLAQVDFDKVYNDAIRPAIEAAEMKAIRADEERLGGIIHKPMFERLLVCDFAIADLTMSNANVFYELGVRHATRPQTTISIFAEGQRLPFDVNFLRAIPYKLGEGNQFGPGEASALTSKLTQSLKELRANLSHNPAVDSPLFQLLTDFKAPDTKHLNTDIFREQVERSNNLKQRLANARDARDPAAVEAIQTDLEPLDNEEPGVLLDLFLSKRALSAWTGMISLYEKLPWDLQRSATVREQLGFALNRAGKRDEALRVLGEVLQQQGQNPETLGLIGRIYKDRWQEARKAGNKLAANGYLRQAIDAYRKGFEADFRDTYPGVNAVTLLYVVGDQKSLREQSELMPVVLFAARQRLKGSKANYWEYATLAELSALDGNADEFAESLGAALATNPEDWMKETTAGNLALIVETRETRGAAEPWLREALAELRPAAS